MMINRPNGPAFGPFLVFPGPTPRSVSPGVLLDPGEFRFGPEFEPPAYVFGVDDMQSMDVVVDSVEPQNQDSVKIAGYVYRVEPHLLDTEIPDPATTGGVIRGRSIPKPDFSGPVEVFQNDARPDIVRVAWPVAEGARYYVVETSTNGTQWSPAVVSFTSSASLPIDAGVRLWVRVAAVSSYYSAWVTVPPSLYGVAFNLPVIVEGSPVLKVLDPDGRQLLAPSIRVASNIAQLEQSLRDLWGEVASEEGLGHQIAQLRGETYVPPPTWNWFGLPDRSPRPGEIPQPP